jgi:hypothetical protein
MRGGDRRQEELHGDAWRRPNEKAAETLEGSPNLIISERV